jgi:hypothetical protein
MDSPSVSSSGIIVGSTSGWNGHPNSEFSSGLYMPPSGSIVSYGGLVLLQGVTFRMMTGVLVTLAQACINPLSVLFTSSTCTYPLVYDNIVHTLFIYQQHPYIVGIGKIQAVHLLQLETHHPHTPLDKEL